VKWAGIAVLIAATASAQTLEERLAALEEALAPAPARKPGEIEAWFDGHLRFGTKDRAFTGRIGGYFVGHLVLYDRLNERDQVDAFLVREAGIEIGARIDRSWEVYLDLGAQEGGSVKLIYGWIEFNRWEELKIRAGLFKEPISMETMEDTRWWDFLENSVAYMHDPLQDTGIMIHGRVEPLAYAVGVFNGNGPSARDENSDKDVAARVVITPSRLLADPLGLDDGFHWHIGLSATHGRQRRDDVSPFPFQEPSTDTDFHVPTGPVDFEIEDLTRARADLAFLIRPVEIKAEFSRLTSDVDFAGDHRRFRSTTWYVQAGVWIGGSRLPFGVPEVDEALFGGGWGALQIAGRYARLRMNDAFEEKAGYAGARSMESLALVVNWFPNANVRVSAEYLFASYEARRVPLPSGRTITDESVFLFRVQISF
jgi:phosphate-selective porin